LHITFSRMHGTMPESKAYSRPMLHCASVCRDYRLVHGESSSRGCYVSWCMLIATNKPDIRPSVPIS